MGELCGSGRIITKEHAERSNNGMLAFWYIPHVREIVRQLEIEYKAPSDKKKARRFALKYDIDKIYKRYWEPLMEEIQEALND